MSQAKPRYKLSPNIKYVLIQRVQFCNKLKLISLSKQCRSSGAFCHITKFSSHLDPLSMMRKVVRVNMQKQHPYLVSLYFFTWPKKRFCVVAYQVTREWVRFHSTSPHTLKNCFPILITDSAFLKIQKWVENSSFKLLDPHLCRATRGKNPLFDFQIKQMRYLDVGELHLKCQTGPGLLSENEQWTSFDVTATFSWASLFQSHSCIKEPSLLSVNSYLLCEHTEKPPVLSYF